MKRRVIRFWAAAALAVVLGIPSEPVDAGWLGRAGLVGVAVAGYEFETIAAGSLTAILAVDTPGYRSAVASLAAKIGAHPFIGPSAFQNGVIQAAQLDPIPQLRQHPSSAI